MSRLLQWQLTATYFPIDNIKNVDVHLDVIKVSIFHFFFFFSNYPIKTFSLLLLGEFFNLKTLDVNLFKRTPKLYTLIGYCYTLPYKTSVLNKFLTHYCFIHRYYWHFY